MSIETKVQGLFLAQPAEIGVKKIASSFVRTSSPNQIVVEPGLLAGNQVADTVHHGGANRVVHHFTGKNYALLAKTFPEAAHKFVPGSFGENLYTEDLNEDEICLADVFSVGETKLQVTSPRYPCKKIDIRYECAGILAWALKTGTVGWFYSVVEGGGIGVGDEFKLVERSTNITLRQLMGIATRRDIPGTLLYEALACSVLAADWQQRLRKRVPDDTLGSS